MRILSNLFVAMLIAVGLCVPLAAGAVGVSFGGRVIGMNFCVNGAIQFTIKPAGALPITYLWTPVTRNNPIFNTPARPPFFGQQVLGVALPAVIGCFGPGKNPVEYFGLPVQYEATSLSI